MDRRLWLLPPGVEELLPPVAASVETLRRQLLDVFECWGYDLVTPPLVEHLDALSVGAGADLASEVFPVTDQLTGRLLGVRTDMTTQVARIDARMARGANGGGAPCARRLAYVGSVLRARAQDAASSRNPVQVGAEIYGHSGLESDFESIALMIESLRSAGIAPLHLDLGHVGVFRELAHAAGLNDDEREQLHAALQRKAVAEIDALFGVDCAARDAAAVRRLRALARLNGTPAIVEVAGEQLAGAPSPALRYLRDLGALASMVKANYPEVEVHIDLAELRGFRYHTGLVFAAFTPGFGREIARGGRYDGIGAAFGEARPATGFSADLRVLAGLGASVADVAAVERVLAPAISTTTPDEALERAVRELRARGVRVIRALPGAEPLLAEEQQMAALVNGPGGWAVRPARGGSLDRGSVR